MQLYVSKPPPDQPYRYNVHILCLPFAATQGLSEEAESLCECFTEPVTSLVWSTRDCTFATRPLTQKLQPPNFYKPFKALTSVYTRSLDIN